MSLLNVENIRKSYGKTEVLKDISFSLKKGEVLAIIGSSGSGKTTLLRCLNFLETPSNGKISVNDKVLFDSNDSSAKSDSEIRKRRLHFGLVFQSFNLFNNMTVLKNCMFGVQKILHLSKEEAKLRAIKLLREVGMAAYINAKPAQLSGGQKQRVAIARGLCMNPEVLLFDEPTSALDPEMVGEVLNVMKELADEGLTIIIVTHDIGVVRAMADTVLVLKNGKMVEYGEAKKVLNHPQDPYTKKLLAAVPRLKRKERA